MREEQSRCRGNISQFENGPQCVRDLMKNYFASKIVAVVAIIVKEKKKKDGAERGMRRGGDCLSPDQFVQSKKENTKIQ